MEREEGERWMRGRIRLEVFWSINFEKHIKRVIIVVCFEF
jgi:hypothetical protein